jgi:hypothetical protein
MAVIVLGLLVTGTLYHGYRLRHAMLLGSVACETRTLTSIIVRCLELGAILVILWGFFLSGAIPHSHGHQSIESIAIGNLRTVLGAENAYELANGRYGTFDALLTEKYQNGMRPYLDGNWTVKNGYRFRLVVGDDGRTFKAFAMPDIKKRSAFYVDESGWIRFEKKGQEPNIGSTPIGSR